MYLPIIVRQNLLYDYKILQFPTSHSLSSLMNFFFFFNQKSVIKIHFIKIHFHLQLKIIFTNNLAIFQNINFGNLEKLLCVEGEKNELFKQGACNLSKRYGFEIRNPCSRSWQINSFPANSNKNLLRLKNESALAPKNVVLITEEGPKLGAKYSLSCRKCKLYYR